MRKEILFCIILFQGILYAQPGTLTEHLKIDQFGYPTTAEKICVINNPQSGFDFDAGDFYTPGATLKVYDADSDSEVYSGPAVSWHSGATYDQSGDKLWWFDFSDVVDPGSYYIYDPTNDTRSFGFEIRDEIYAEVLKQAMRMFYYQRSGFAKAEEYAGVWNDAASHLGVQQDLDCRLVTNPVSGTSKDLQGGWFDAGDYNKYVNFAYEPIHDLMLAYIERPEIWTDDYDIPESGNGIPDLLDEVKWELDWLRRMQEDNGSVLMKVSVTGFESASPPSADDAFRRYGPAQASATRTAASMFAISAIAFELSGVSEMQLYADTLEDAAIDAWDWLVANPGFSYYNTDGYISANPEMTEYQQTAAQIGAAIALFARTGNTAYRTYVDHNYTQVHCLQWTYWYPWESIIQDLLLYYASLPDATSSVANAIRNSFTTSLQNNDHLLPAYNNTSCGYKGYLNDGDNVWGSNRPRGHNGSTFFNAITYNLPVDTADCRNAALGYVNFLHGVNPISTIMLTNMYDYGGDKSANEMYHGWFGDGTDYDNALTSLYGPAPGYQPGGFNPNYQPDGAFGGTIVPPQFQPSLKSYKDWNTSWPENSWEVTETSISNQGSYIKLLSKFVTPATCVTTITNTGDSGVGTLRDALDCANPGDTILLQLAVTDTIFLDDTLVFDKSVTVLYQGGGSLPVYSASSGVGFLVDSAVVLHLHNLTLGASGTSVVENAGAVHFHHVRIDASQASGLALDNRYDAHAHGVVEVLK
jgi:hypothetical protein